MADREKPRDELAGSAIWFNKREVARVDFTVEHTLTPQNDGWRVDFHDGGSIRVSMAQGGKEMFGVVAGDALLSSGEDFYLTLHGGDEDRRERKERSEAKRAAREARRGDGDDRENPASRDRGTGSQRGSTREAR